MALFYRYKIETEHQPHQKKSLSLHHTVIQQFLGYLINSINLLFIINFLIKPVDIDTTERNATLHSEG